MLYRNVEVSFHGTIANQGPSENQSCTPAWMHCFWVRPLDDMSNKHRQRIVGSIGLLVASFGLLFRFAIFNTWSYKYLSLIATFGRNNTAAWGTPTVQVPYDVFSNIAMALVYAGIVLMVAAVLAWLFMSPEKDTDEKDAAS